MIFNKTYLYIVSLESYFKTKNRIEYVITRRYNQLLNETLAVIHSQNNN